MRGISNRYYYSIDIDNKKIKTLSIQKIIQCKDKNGSEKYCIINFNSGKLDSIYVNDAVFDKNEIDYIPVFLTKFQLFNNIFSLDFNQEKIVHASSNGIAIVKNANSNFNFLLASKGVDHAYNNPIISKDGSFLSCVEYLDLYRKPKSNVIIYDFNKHRIAIRKRFENLLEARLSPDNKKLLLVCQDDLLNNFFSKKEVTKKNFKIYLYDLENNKLEFISYGINACWIS